MFWILACRSISYKLKASPFTETAIANAHSVVYKPGVEVIVHDGETNPLGTFDRGLHRCVGFVYTYDGTAAEALLSVTDQVDLIVRYRSGTTNRKRTFDDVIFVGDSAVTFPNLNSGLGELVGIPFRVQMPEGDTLSGHVIDATD